MDLAPDNINKKLGRAVQYEGDHVRLFVVVTDPENANSSIFKQVGRVPRAEAHDWFHGNERHGVVPETDPTVDEMLQVITEQLKADVRPIIDHALLNEENLRHLFLAAKRGRLVRACW